MLIISIIFGVFLAFWTFSGAFIHAVIDIFDPFDDEYNENRFLRVIQGFCAVFEIVLAGVTFCQRTSEQEGQVATAPQVLVTVQQGVQPGYQQGVQVNLFQKHLFLHQLTHNMANSAVFQIERFPGDQKTAITRESLYLKQFDYCLICLLSLSKF